MTSKMAFMSKIILSVLVISFLAASGPAFAEDAQVVLIFQAKGDNTELRLNPPDLYVKKGTIVIWMNSVMGEEVQVVFRDGKTCKDVSYSPVEKGFSLDAKSCYVTSFIPYASTSSLQFTDTGSFDYAISNLTGKINGKGKIIVRDM
jgi:hypothetical protein